MTHAAHSVEEEMLRDWATVGLQRLEDHLAQQAAFATWVERREAGVDNGADR